MKEIVLATENLNKLKELRAIEQQSYLILDLSHLKTPLSWDETGSSFYENALIKAKTAKAQTNLGVLGEDSGLVVEDLGGEPGVYSKRYAGPECTDGENVQKLLSELKRVQSVARRAYFITSLVYIDETSQEYAYEGKCHGTLLEAPKGKEGFGYDPIFVPRGYDQSFAQLPLATKNTMSHRLLAFKAFLNAHS